jgi:hypothetical protein
VAKNKPFNHRVPVALDQELFNMIHEIAELWGEADSTVMRQAMRLGLPILRSEIERVKQGVSVKDPFPPHRNSLSIIEDADPPKKKGPK